ncbi:MAG: hypothetical protein R3B45_00945 [Bdellovibrionota bacterium]
MKRWLEKLYLINILSLTIYYSLTLFIQPQMLASNSNRWLKVEIGIIGTASQDILSSALDQAKGDEYQGIIIQLDTPGEVLKPPEKW